VRMGGPLLPFLAFFNVYVVDDGRSVGGSRFIARRAD
jgi:hypothetical protein